MMTPEPIPDPLWVVTLTWTTAGRTLATTASRTASVLLPLTAGMVGAGFVPGCNWAVPGWFTTVELRPNCQPANKPVPKMNASKTVNAKMDAVRTPLEGRCGGCG